MYRFFYKHIPILHFLPGNTPAAHFHQTEMQWECHLQYNLNTETFSLYVSEMGRRLLLYFFPYARIQQLRALESF